MNLENLINEAWENRNLLKEKTYKEAIENTIELLDKGQVCVVQKNQEEWITIEWVKKAILLYFLMKEVNEIESGLINYVDKIPLKTINKESRIRVVPGAIIRKGSFIEENCIIMPAFINIGARVCAGTLVDTWATVGSCAYVGKNVHISGGVGIGGVLEPPQARPVIIEDNSFIGSRCIIVEGVIIKEGAVLAAGTILTASTKIIDINTGEIHKGIVPPNSIVIQGYLKRENRAIGEFYTPAAFIVKKKTPETLEKTKINEILREWNTSL